MCAEHKHDLLAIFLGLGETLQVKNLLLSQIWSYTSSRKLAICSLISFTSPPNLALQVQSDPAKLGHLGAVVVFDQFLSPEVWHRTQTGSDGVDRSARTEDLHRFTSARSVRAA